MSFNMAAPRENSIVQNESRADSFPIKTKQTSTTINGEKVEILCSHFSDRLFVVVTQLNKLGTMVEVTRDVVLNDGMGTQKPALSTKVLLGVDEPLTHVVAKNLVSKIESVKPILLSMALKDTSAETVRSLAEVVKEITIS